MDKFLLIFTFIFENLFFPVCGIFAAYILVSAIKEFKEILKVTTSDDLFEPPNAQ